MSLRRAPQSQHHEVWIALIAMGVAAIACVQLLTGTAPLFWLLLACGALWALLIQASHVDDAAPVRVRATHISPRSKRR